MRLIHRQVRGTIPLVLRAIQKIYGCNIQRASQPSLLLLVIIQLQIFQRVFFAKMIIFISRF